MSRLKPRPTNLSDPSRGHLALLTSSILVLGFVARPPRRAGIFFANGNQTLASKEASYNFGAESAAVLQPRATPWVSEYIGAPCKGGGILSPCRAQHVRGDVPGALPRAGILRADGA